jgi:hypothetical protein
MQPKPIDSRHLLDIDRLRRVVDMEGFAEHLRAVREHKENPEETDYDVAHDEEGRGGRERTARQPGEAVKQKAAPTNGKKGTRLDIEA